MPQKKARKIERRRLARAEANLSMRVETPPADGMLTQIVTESQNISASGVYCSSPHYLAPLSKVALTIVLPAVPGSRGSQRLFKCDGIVVRCQACARPVGDGKFELACSFIGLDERLRRLLSDFVAWRNLQALQDAGSRAIRPRSAVRRTAKAGVRRAASSPRRGTTNGAARSRGRAR